MDRSQLLNLLEQVRAGTLAPADAAEQVATLPFAEVNEAIVVDPQRELRTGVPELVYGASKTPDQIVAALRGLAAKGAGALATRVDADKAARVRALEPAVTVHELARIVTLGTPPRG